jgi:cobalt-zinc-cadmium efflux system outer membrane protein
MEKTLLKILVSFAVAGVTPLPARAPSSTPNQITPDELAEQALERNPELNFYRAEIAAAKGQLRTVGTLANPELSTQLGYKNAHDSSGSRSGVAFALSLSQTLEFPGRIALRRAIATGDIRLAEVGFEQFRATLIARVRALTYRLALDQEQIGLVREVAQRFRALADTLMERAPAGPAPVLETRLIDGSALTFEREAAEADLAAKEALIELNQLRGAPSDATLELHGGRLLLRPFAVGNLVTIARAYAHDVRLRQVELQQQRFKRELARNERYPALTFGPYFSREEAADIEYQTGIGMSLPLPFWNRNRGNIETSKARVAQAQTAVVTAQREVELRVRKAALIVQQRRETLGKTEGGLQKFREVAESADRDFRRGAIPLATYIESQKQHLEAANAIFDAKKDALQAAQELELLTGQKVYGSVR